MTARMDQDAQNLLVVVVGFVAGCLALAIAASRFLSAREGAYARVHGHPTKISRSQPKPSAFCRSGVGGRRSVRKTRAQQAKSDELAVKRQATCGKWVSAPY